VGNKGLIFFLAAWLPWVALHSQSPASDGGRRNQPEGTYLKVSHRFAGNPSTSELLQLVQQKLKWAGRSQTTLHLIAVRESPGGYHYQFRQEFDGLPVTGKVIQVNMTREFRVLNFGSSLLDEEFGTSGSFLRDENEAVKYVRDNYHSDQPWFQLKLERQYYPQSGNLIPAFCIQTYGDGVETNYEIILNASDMSLLQERELISHFRPVHASRQFTSGDTNCPGKVFLPDPLTTAHVVYGTPYTNGSSIKTGECDADDDSPWLNGQRAAVTLRELEMNNGVITLTGPYVSVRDSIEAPFYTDPVGINNCNFEFKRLDQGFEAVNSYYHIDTFQRYVQSLGFTSLMNEQILVDPHGVSCKDNSKFVPNGSNPWLSFGEGCVDDAEDADVIIHEYGHALSYAALPGANVGSERSGIDEGIGDYFASSYSASIDTFGWNRVFTWDGHNEPECWEGRISNSTITYPQTNVFDIYQVGELWSSALMQVFWKIGRTASDRIQLQELSMNIQTTKIPDAAMYILDADTMLYSGQYSQDYIDEFCLRQILTGGICVVGNSPMAPPPVKSVIVYPVPADDKIRVTIPPAGNPVDLIVTDIYGRIVIFSEDVRSETDINVSHLNSGIYYVSVSGLDAAIPAARMIITK